MYRIGTTLKKAVLPPSLIIGFANFLQNILSRFEIEINDESSYVLITSIYGIVTGFVNWFKNKYRK